MDSISWESSFSVGVTIIDEEHKRLFSLINSLQECCASGDEKLLLGILLGLKNYTETHFTVEEELMLVYNYPGYHDHKAAHEQFKERIENLYETLQDGILDIPDSLFKFLQQWLIGHIQKTDMALGKYLQDKPFLN